MELLVATILSAQCTDVRVNKITPGLFKRYKTVKDFAYANLKELEMEIKSTGFYRNKSKNIINSAKKILSDFNGRVPDSMEKLLTLPGVARKTANIVLHNAFGKIEGIAVDTHVKRLSKLIGLTKNDNPNKIEIDLMDITEKKNWPLINYLLVLHGRKICIARKPNHLACVINKCCDFYQRQKW